MTHSLQSQRSMHDSGFEGTASASSSASKNTGVCIVIACVSDSE